MRTRMILGFSAALALTLVVAASPPVAASSENCKCMATLDHSATLVTAPAAPAIVLDTSPMALDTSSARTSVDTGPATLLNAKERDGTASRQTQGVTALRDNRVAIYAHSGYVAWNDYTDTAIEIVDGYRHDQRALVRRI